MNNSIQKRLLLGILLITTSLLFIAGIFNHLWINNTVTKLSEEKASIMAKETAVEVENYLLQQGGQFAISIAEQEQVHLFVQNLENRDQDLSQNHNYQELIKSFKRIAFTDPNIDEVYIAAAKTKIIYDNLEYENPPSYDATSRPWYKAAVKARRLVFTPPYLCPVTGLYVITASIPFYDDDGNLLGVAAVDILADKMQNIVHSVRVSDSGHAFMLDNDGTIISHPDENYLNQSLFNQDQFSPNIKQITSRMIAGKSGFDKIKIQGEDKYLFYSPLQSIGWSIGIVLPVNDVVSTIGQIQFITITLTILLISILVSVFTSRISRPLKEFTQLIHHIENGDYTCRVQITSDDEIGRLGNSVNKMLDTQEGFISQISSISYKIGVSSHILALKLGEMQSLIPLITSDLRQLTEQFESDPHMGTISDINKSMQDFMEKLIYFNYTMRSTTVQIEELSSSLDNDVSCLNDELDHEKVKNKLLDIAEQSIQKCQYLNNIQGDFADIINSIQTTDQGIIDRFDNLKGMENQINNLTVIYADSLEVAGRTASELIILSRTLSEITSEFKITHKPALTYEIEPE